MATVRLVGEHAKPDSRVVVSDLGSDFAVRRLGVVGGSSEPERNLNGGRPYNEVDHRSQQAELTRLFLVAANKYKPEDSSTRPSGANAIDKLQTALTSAMTGTGSQRKIDDKEKSAISGMAEPAHRRNLDLFIEKWNQEVGTMSQEQCDAFLILARQKVSGSESLISTKELKAINAVKNGQYPKNFRQAEQVAARWNALFFADAYPILGKKEPIQPSDVEKFLQDFQLNGIPLEKYQQFVEIGEVIPGLKYFKAKYSTTELEEIARTANQEANSLPAAEAKPYAENEAKFVQNLVAAAKAQDSFKGEFPPEKYGPNGEMLAILAQTYRIEIPENEMSAFLVGDILDTVFFRGPGRSFDVEDGNWKLGFYFVRTRFSNKPIGNAVAFVIDRDSHDYGRIVPTYDSNIGGAFWHRIEDKQDERPGRSAGVRWVKGNKAWEVGVDSIADRLEKAFKNGGGNAG